MNIELNGAHYHVIDEGRGEQVVLLLHGMPDTAQVWRHQIDALVQAGFRVIAPDMLGYGLTDKPQDSARYKGEQIIGDMLALIDTLQLQNIDVVGHDWGAFVSWELVLNAPELFRRHVAVSVGHPDRMMSMSGPEEVKESWYMYLNALPETDRLYAARDGAFFRQFIIPTHPEADEVWSRMKDPRALTGMLNWDRANPMSAFYLAMVTNEAGARKCQVPTLGIWSSGDTYLWEDQIRTSDALMDAAWRYERIEGASHWAMLDAPERVSALLLDFLGSN
ncbi:MAG: alpha/beta hydrolase [Pseudomonadota bacterium]|nr:alpha/beta hydrolase [Pseudomonadota bacterium]